MNLWDEHVLPRATERVLDNPTIARLRGRAVAGLSGDVVEIGFGSGLNVAYLPSAVTSLAAVEPSRVARQRAQSRLASAPFSVTFVGLDGQQLPLPTASMDSALSTFTLCTIPQPERALAELRRVLKPGGSVHFLEHGLSPEPKVVRWQRRLNPMQRRLAGGCTLDRDIAALIEESGFSIVALENEALPGPAVLAPFGYVYLGRAVAPRG